MTGDFLTWHEGQPFVSDTGTGELGFWFGGQPFVNLEKAVSAGIKGIKLNTNGDFEETSILTKVIKIGTNGREEVDASGGGVKIITFGVNGLTEVVS